jgi:hemolysin III
VAAARGAAALPQPEVPQPPKPRYRGRIHQFAAFVTVPAAIVLIVLSYGLKLRIASTIYGLTLVNMFSTSAIYHRRTWTEKARRRIQALDHSAIYLLIAGTYTPLSVIATDGWLRPAMLALVWGGAAVMVTLKQVFPGRFAALAGAMYIVLGWAAVIAAPQFVRTLPPVALWLVVLGGLLYTGGALVLNRHWPDPNPLVFGYHEVWHVFMTSAAACHYVAILLTVLAVR